MAWFAAAAVALVAGLLWIDSERLERRADQSTFDPVAGGVVDGAERAIFDVRRVGLELSAHLAAPRLAAQLEDFSATLPATSCLTVTTGSAEAVAVGEPILRTPASTLKLLVGATALELFGPNHRLATELWSDAELSAEGTLQGDLYVVGAGDPLLATPSYAEAHPRQPQPRTPVEDLATLAHDLGIRSINGRILGDETRYDDQRYVPTWPERYRTQHNAGPLSALSVNDGFSAIEPTVVAAPEPALWAAQALQANLFFLGVGAEGGAGVGRRPPAARLMGRLESLPMRDVVAQMLTESDNNTAELLTKELGFSFGVDGSTTAGLEVVTATMSRLGVDMEGAVLVDGSGLDPANRISCKALAQVLDAFGADSHLGDALATAGRTGTMTDRLLGTPAEELVRAKTGFINTVSGLAGFARSADGPWVTFALLADNLPLDPSVGIGLQDALAIELVETHPWPDLEDLDG